MGKWRQSIGTIVLLWILAAGSVWADGVPISADVKAILDGLQKRYHEGGFAARFEQVSTLKAMDIQDNASGEIQVKYPGKMRWTYLVPDHQVIISDGDALWIHRPDENQVMVGKAPAFFGGGKGAGFLSDIGSVAQHFSISRANEALSGDDYRLKLVPLKEQMDISEIYLTIARAGYEILDITTYNAYGDETVIALRDTRFGLSLEDALFEFQIPVGADVVQLEQ